MPYFEAGYVKTFKGNHVRVLSPRGSNFSFIFTKPNAAHRKDLAPFC